MPNCAVFGCSNTNRMKDSEEIKFYSFPKNEDLALQWVHACCRQDKLNRKNAVICSKHFESKCFFTSLKYQLLNESPPKTFRNLKDDSVPTLFLPKKSAMKNSSNERTKKMKAKDDLKIIIKEVWSESNDSIEMHSENGSTEFPTNCTINRDKVTEQMEKMKDEMEKMKLKIILLENEVSDLKVKNEKLNRDKLISNGKLLLVLSVSN